MNLYNIFRALKEQSYTYSLVLQLPVGTRKGKIFLSTLYGPPNSGYTPLLWLKKTNSNIAKHIRDTVSQSHIENFENPYDLSILFAKQGPSA
jgi:hypothetical protein